MLFQQGVALGGLEVLGDHLGARRVEGARAEKEDEDNGDEVIILPGMVASIDVLSGKRTILDYFWQPISKTKDTAFRE